MTPQHHQVAHWMNAQHRLVRFTPVTDVPVLERADTAANIFDAYRTFTEVAKCAAGKAYATAPVGVKINPEHVLSALTLLYAQVLAAFHTFGLSDAAAGALYELTNTTLPRGAGPAPHSSDFAKVLKTTYNYPPVQ